MHTNQTKSKTLSSLETLAVKKKCDDIKTVSLCNKRNPTNANAQKRKKAQSELTHTKKNIQDTSKTRLIRLETLLKIDNQG